MGYKLFISVVFCSTLGFSSAQTEILRPIKEGKDVGLVILPGGFLEPYQYRVLGQTLQSATKFRLWVFLAEGLLLSDNKVAQAPEDTTVGDAKAKLLEAGMPANSPFFAAGHSMGGRISAIELEEYPQMAEAIILLGSKFDYPANTYPVPAMTITGDLDGLNRIGTVAEVFNDVKQFVEGTNPEYKYRYPVKMIEGTNHMSFITGPTTEFTDAYDIDAEIDDEVARDQTVQAMDLFMRYFINAEEKTECESVMDLWYEETSTITEPVISAFLMDEDPATQKSAWVAQAQQQIAGLNAQNIKVNEEVVDENLLPVVLPSFSYNSANQLVVNSFVSVAYDIFASAVDYSSPYMLEAKLKNGDDIANQLGVTSGPYVSCSDINRKAWEAIMEMIPRKNKDRFLRKNIEVNFEDDEEVIFDATWLAAELKFEFNAATSSLAIQSTVLWTSSTGEDYDGMQYCKLLAPSRALEFIYTDSLRNYN